MALALGLLTFDRKDIQKCYYMRWKAKIPSFPTHIMTFLYVKYLKSYSNDKLDYLDLDEKSSAHLKSLTVTEAVALVIAVELADAVDSENVSPLRLAHKRESTQFNQVLDKIVGDLEEILTPLINLA